MSYNDIDDWADENIPMDLYNTFDEWINDIEANFAQHGHHFPDGMRENLRQHWLAEMGEEDLEEPEESFAEPEEFRAPPPPPREPTPEAPIVSYRDQRDRIIIKEIGKAPVIIEPSRFEVRPVKELTTAEKFAQAKKARRGQNN